jgi:hypothetical protein
MAKFQLVRFEQGRFLRNETDPDVAGGICVALCNAWLKAMLVKPDEAPERRMQMLATQIAQAKAQQKAYGQLRQAHGPDEARRQLGAPQGMDFDAKTAVVRLNVGRTGILAKVQQDLRLPGAAHAFTMRFTTGGGHAIAGFNRLTRVTGNIATMTVQLFDPNIGEYTAGFDGLKDVVDDLFNSFPDYANIGELRRSDVRPI